MANIIKLQTYSKLGYIQSFVHAPNNPFGQHLSKDTIHAPTDGRKSGHFQGRLGINQVQNLELFHLTAHAIGYTAQAGSLLFHFGRFRHINFVFVWLHFAHSQGR